MAEESKPGVFPPAVEEDEEEEEPASTLPEDVVEREAERAIEEIDQEMEEEHPAKPPAPPPRVIPEGPQKSFLDKAWERQYQLEARLKQVGHGRFSRVLKMARKPEHEEFVKATQITAIGIAVVGTIGFAILLFMTWLMGVLGVR